MALPDALSVLDPLLLSRCTEAMLRELDLASRNLTRLPAESTELRLLDVGLELPVKAVPQLCSLLYRSGLSHTANKWFGMRAMSVHVQRQMPLLRGRIGHRDGISCTHFPCQA